MESGSQVTDFGRFLHPGTRCTKQAQGWGFIQKRPAARAGKIMTGALLEKKIKYEFTLSIRATLNKMKAK